MFPISWRSIAKPLETLAPDWRRELAAMFTVHSCKAAVGAASTTAVAGPGFQRDEHEDPTIAQFAGL
jgi:hypothetical protein